MNAFVFHVPGIDTKLPSGNKKLKIVYPRKDGSNYE